MILKYSEYFIYRNGDQIYKNCQKWKYRQGSQIQIELFFSFHHMPHMCPYFHPLIFIHQSKAAKTRDKWLSPIRTFPPSLLYIYTTHTLIFFLETHFILFPASSTPFFSPSHLHFALKMKKNLENKPQTHNKSISTHLAFGFPLNKVRFLLKFFNLFL